MSETTQMAFWLESCLKRVYPATPANDAPSIRLLAARNERVSFQACARNSNIELASVEVFVDGVGGLETRIRRVGYVPMAHFNTATEVDELEGVGHVPGYVPDPLFPESKAIMGPLETHAFYITVTVPADVEPGLRELEIRFNVDDKPSETLRATIDVRSLVIGPRQNFHSTHWFYTDALCSWYKVEPFEEKFWTIVEPYMKDIVEHGQNCLHTPIFTPPTDGVKRPTQLLKVTTPSEGQYEFDFSDVKRWTDLAQRCGVEMFEWSHIFTQWGCQNAIRVYRSNQDPDSLLWPHDTQGMSDVYRNFLAQFLPAFKAFLDENGLTERSLFHVSDEPHGDEHLKSYSKARAMLRELAPWMKVMDALSDLRFAQEGLTDMPVAGISVAKQFSDAGVPCWVYFCCGPRGNFLNRFLDTPLVKIRMSGWLFYALRALGFLHWGYNYWQVCQKRELIDPFTETAAGHWPWWAYGDTFMVYPGENGPIDSIRWEAFSDSLQDYALLQSAGIDPASALLSEIRDYDDFPKTEEWIRKTREKALMGM